jgi:hypothetical protein
MSLLIPFICYLTANAEAAQIFSTSTYTVIDGM